MYNHTQVHMVLRILSAYPQVPPILSVSLLTVSLFNYNFGFHYVPIIGLYWFRHHIRSNCYVFLCFIAWGIFNKLCLNYLESGTAQHNVIAKDNDIFRLDIDYRNELIFRLAIRGFFRAKLTELQIYNNLKKITVTFCCTDKLHSIANPGPKPLRGWGLRVERTQQDHLSEILLSHRIFCDWKV